MARFALAAVGFVVGFVIGGPVGAMIGMSIGGMVGSMLFPPNLGHQFGPRLNDLQVSSSTNGQGIPFGWGRQRVPGQLIWSPGLVEHVTTTEHSAKGGPTYTTTSYTYTCSFAASFGEGPADIQRVWGDSKVLLDVSPRPSNLYNSIQVTTLTCSAWNGNGTGIFNRTSVASPVYTHTGFKGLMFNTHPKQLFPGDPHDSADESRPPVHHPVTTYGTYGGDERMTGVPTGSFDMIIEAKFGISQPGDYTFKVFSDDGYFIGIAPEEGSGNTVSIVTGPGGPAPQIGKPYADTPKNHYPIAWAMNQAQSYKTSGRDSVPAIIHFPTAGWYPFELCWAQLDSYTQMSVMSGDGRSNWSLYKVIKPSDGVNLPPIAPLTTANTSKYAAPALYTGDESQLPNSTIQAHDGVAKTPAFRGQAYAVWTDFPLEDFGNRVPNIRGEVVFRLANGDDATLASSMVTNICQRVGLDSTEVDTTDLAGLSLTGFAVGRPNTGRNLIAPLAQAFFFDGLESDGKLKFIQRGHTAALNIPENDLGAKEENAKLTESYTQEQELPKTVEILYADPDLDYQQGKQSKSRHSRTVKTQQLAAYELPLAMTRDAARQIAEKALYLAYMERKPYSFTLTDPKYLPLDPTDVITFDHNGFNFKARITKTSIGTGYGVAVQCVSEDAANYLSTQVGASVDGFVGGQIAPLPDTLLWLFDLPLLRDVDANSTMTGYYFAASAVTNFPGQWPGMVLMKSSDDTNFFAEASSGSLTHFGSAVGVLAAPTSPFSWDRDNTLTVQMAVGDFATVTDTDVLDGHNAILVGNEVVQYRDAVQNTDGSWTLSTLLRGRRGTEWACGTHADGDAVIDLIAAGVQRMSVPLSVISQLKYYRPVTIGTDVTSVTSQTMTLAGNDLKPYAPCYIQGTRAGDDLTITWSRRTRIGSTKLSGTQPLNEQSEAYEIDVMSGITVKRTITGLTSPTAAYSGADQTTDFGSAQASVTVNVYQLSAQVGRGFVGTAAI